MVFWKEGASCCLWQKTIPAKNAFVKGSGCYAPLFLSTQGHDSASNQAGRKLRVHIKHPFSKWHKNHWESKHCSLPDTLVWSHALKLIPLLQNERWHVLTVHYTNLSAFSDSPGILCIFTCLDYEGNPLYLAVACYPETHPGPAKGDATGRYHSVLGRWALEMRPFHWRMLPGTVGCVAP